MDGLIADLGRRALDGQRLGRLDLIAAAQAGRDRPYDLMYWANEVRTARFGSAVRFCSIAPGKLGGCTEDCKWCAQSAVCASPPKPPGRTGIAEIVAAAADASRLGAASFGIVNSGRRPTQRDLADVAEALARIKAEIKPPAALQTCASLGELTDEQASRLAAAGVRRYNHNLETSRGFFPKVVTTHSYDDRLRAIAAARAAGMSLCCGGIFGLGETWADRVDLALALRDEVRPDVVPLNFLHPIPGTPLQAARPLEPVEILRIIAVFRLAMPEVDLKIAGGREKNLRDLQGWMFYAGATSCLLGNYLTTSGRAAQEDLQMVADLGLKLVAELPAARRPAVE